MAYIGKGLDNGVRNQFIFAATQGQTAFSGADSDGKTLAISDILYTDCFQNGVKLEPTTDYTVTLTSLTLVNAASLNDVVDIVSFDIFAVPDTVPASTGGTFNGKITADAGIDIDNINIDGTTIALSSGNLLLDVAGNITLDADTSNIFLADAGTNKLEIDWGAANVAFKNVTSDGDLLFGGNDGGATITALTLDMSEAGSATFNHDVKLNDDGQVLVGTGGDLSIFHSSNNNFIRAKTSDQDILIQGSDGGTNITAVTFDMSAAGLAIFNAGIALGGTGAANTLDDYEEGTWTAAVTTGVTLSVSAGTYTKIGRQVTVSGRFNVGSVSSPSGGSITGLPFTSGSGTGFDTAGSLWLNSINTQEGKTLQIRMDQNTNNLVFTDLAGGNASGASSYLKSGSVINLSFTYFTA